MSFEEIFERIQKSRSMLANRRKTFNEAKDSFSILESKCEDVKQSISVADFGANLAEVKSQMEKHNYSEAYRISKETLVEIDSSLDSWRPNLKLKLPDNMTPGKWKKYDLMITNEGNAHALNVDIQFYLNLQLKMPPPPSEIWQISIFFALLLIRGT